jgi:hypothetical protein
MLKSFIKIMKRNMLKKRVKYYNILERRYYHKSSKVKARNQNKILQEREN